MRYGVAHCRDAALDDVGSKASDRLGDPLPRVAHGEDGRRRYSCGERLGQWEIVDTAVEATDDHRHGTIRENREGGDSGEHGRCESVIDVAKRRLTNQLGRYEGQSTAQGLERTGQRTDPPFDVVGRATGQLRDGVQGQSHVRIAVRTQQAERRRQAGRVARHVAQLATEALGDE